ncbi:MAG TPA: glycoside hydrolase, partial [Verrucomicrobiae bacterium]
MTFLKKTAGLPASGGLGLVSLILAVATAIVAAAPVDVEPQVFVLDTGIRHQVMDNFGANDAWSMQKIGLWSEVNKNKIADLLFSTNTGIGLSCWRFYFGAGLNHQTIRDDWRTAESFETTAGQYDWTRQPGARWFLRAA